jgi:glycosyltransferase involved in cell wall biosynthesis
MASSDMLIDVSRLVWRMWRGRLPTGIDRACLAYVEHFRGRTRAVVQYRGRYRVLSARHSGELFDLFLRGPIAFRSSFIKFAARAFPAARSSGDEGQLYLNVGHTGLDEPSLGDWVKRSGLRAVYLIHDLIPVLYPEYCRAGERPKHVRRMDNVLRCASGIIGNSQTTIDELAAFAAASSLPMPPSVRAFIAGPEFSADLRPKSLDRPHFVIVGTIEARKNHLLLLHIWRKLVAKHGSGAPLLIIVGQRGWEASNAIAMIDRATDLKGHVVELGGCSDQDLASVIVGARALLMPSFAEGFGLPVAEALQLGTPVIASDLPVFREFAGDIPTYLDPLDGIGWESAIMAFGDDTAERMRQLEAVRGYSAPDWSTHFHLVENWLSSAKLGPAH